MFSSMQTPNGLGLKRSREHDEDEAQQLQSHSVERRIARARDNSNNHSIAASNISENRISSSSFFLPSCERSSPPRPRSNALSLPQTTITPCPSDNEELHHAYNHGFTKIPNLSLRSRKATANPFSAEHSPAASFDSSQSQNEDCQDTSMVTDDSQNDSLMDMDMDDTPQLSQESSSANKHTSTSFDNFHGHGSSIAQATNFLQTSRRLPSPANSDDNGRDMSPSTELENFGEIGIQLQGAQQENEGKWKASSGSRNLGHVANGLGSESRPKMCMGFRADCDKCVKRVPGHYMHII